MAGILSQPVNFLDGKGLGAKMMRLMEKSIRFLTQKNSIREVHIQHDF